MKIRPDFTQRTRRISQRKRRGWDLQQALCKGFLENVVNELNCSKSIRINWKYLINYWLPLVIYVFILLLTEWKEFHVLYGIPYCAVIFLLLRQDKVHPYTRLQLASFTLFPFFLSLRLYYCCTWDWLYDFGWSVFFALLTGYILLLYSLRFWEKPNKSEPLEILKIVGVAGLGYVIIFYKDFIGQALTSLGFIYAFTHFAKPEFSARKQNVAFGLLIFLTIYMIMYSWVQTYYAEKEESKIIMLCEDSDNTISRLDKKLHKCQAKVDSLNQLLKWEN